MMVIIPYLLAGPVLKVYTYSKYSHSHSRCISGATILVSGAKDHEVGLPNSVGHWFILPVKVHTQYEP